MTSQSDKASIDSIPISAEKLQEAWEEFKKKQTPESVVKLNQDFTKRQVEIDSKLTPEVVKSIFQENKDKILKELMNSEKRFVVIIYGYTPGLLRRINGDMKEKPLEIWYSTLEEGKEMNPNSKLVKNCNPKTSFCIQIATSLPTSVLGEGDSIYTHSITEIRFSS